MYIWQSQSPSSSHLPFPLCTHMIVLYVCVSVYDFTMFYDYCLAPGSRALFVNRNPGHSIQIQSIQSVCSGAVVKIKQNEANTGLSLSCIHTHTHTHTHMTRSYSSTANLLGPWIGHLPSLGSFSYLRQRIEMLSHTDI